MKIKGLLISMLACTAMLVGCSDDAIDNIAQENNELKSDAKGYLTVSFSAGTNSSRGLYDNANGDIHNSAETSGHLNVGTTEENKINSVLIVINSGDNEYSKIFKTKVTNVLETEGYSEASSGICNTTPFEVELGEYKTLVVINPSESVKTLRDSAQPDEDGKTTATNVSLYNNILSHKIKPTTAETWTWNTSLDAVMSQTVAGTKTYDNFMMTNRLPASITVTAQNSTKETAAKVKGDGIEVERVVSKITFRENIYSDNNDGNLTVITETQRPNLYKVPFMHYEIKEVIKTATCGEEPITATRCKYVDANNATVIVYKSAENYYSLSEDEKTFTLATIPEGTTPEIYYNKTEEAIDKGWYIKLESYALVNLSQDLYAVRHIGTADYEGENTYQIMGALNDTYKYLVDPVSAEKNAIVWGSDGSWPTGANYNNWFFNSWEKVKAETLANYKETTSSFISFTNNNITADNPQDVESTHTNINDEEISEIGKTLGYCFENAVKQFNVQGQDLQTVGLSTAIVFGAKIMEMNNGTLSEIDDQLYQYEGNLYTCIEDIKLLYGYSSNDSWKNLTDPTEGSQLSSETIAALENLGVKIYQGGKCYYYTSQIKHYDDGNNTTNGVMEFAIMRNNIYSLAVTGIQHIGDANLDGFNPADPDESATAYIQVNAKILPWIVRFTDVEF